MWRYSIQNFTFLEGMYISASSNKKLDFAFLVSPWIWRRWEQGLGRVSQLTWGGCLFWGRQSYITRALWHGCMLPNHALPLPPALLHPSVPSFISQALWDSVFCLSLLALPSIFALDSLDAVFFSQAQMQWEFWERVRQQNIAPRPVYLFNTCFFRYASCWHPSKWVTAFLQHWQPVKKKTSCLRGCPWLWVTGISVAINLPAGLGSWAGIQDKHINTRSQWGKGLLWDMVVLYFCLWYLWGAWDETLVPRRWGLAW